MNRLLIILLALAVSACGAPQPPLVASAVEITRPMPGRSMSAGFLVLENTTSDPITITQVASPQFAAVEIHETTIEDGISRMRKVDALIVPAKGSMVLERGGKHLMLMRATNLENTVTLQFMSEDAPVLNLNYSFPLEKD